jgi:hypothetical protein
MNKSLEDPVIFSSSIIFNRFAFVVVVYGIYQCDAQL